jgi:CopG family transcriptional regulator/antitoxin EndoAI
MAKRINVVFQDETAKTVERSAKLGERSRFIDRAVQYYAATHSAEVLREQLKRAAIRDRDLSEEIAHDWFAVDRESWQTADASSRETRRPTRSAGKSTS